MFYIQTAKAYNDNDNVEKFFKRVFFWVKLNNGTREEYEKEENWHNAAMELICYTGVLRYFDWEEASSEDLIKNATHQKLLPLEAFMLSLYYTLTSVYGFSIPPDNTKIKDLITQYPEKELIETNTEWLEQGARGHTILRLNHKAFENMKSRLDRMTWIYD